MPVVQEKYAELRVTGNRTVEAGRFGPSTAFPLTVGFVHSKTYHHEFAWSYCKLLMACKQRVTVIPIRSGPNISNPRNDLISAFLQNEDKALLMLDTDIEFEPEHVEELLSHLDEYPLLGGVYRNVFTPGEEPIIVASVRTGPGTFAHGDAITQEHGIIPVAGLGMGFTLIRRDVCEALGPGAPLWPFAELAVPGSALGAETPEEKAVTHMLSEDITFCFRAAAAGFQPYLDLDCRVKHHKETVYE